MKKLAVAAVFVLNAFCSSAGLGKEVIYVSPLRGLSLLEPKYPPPPSGAKSYCDTQGGSLSWSIAQWSNPGGALPDFQQRAEGSSTIFETIGDCSRVKLELTPQTSRLVLEQDGHLLPCYTSAGSPREWDLFAQPNGPNVKAPRSCGLPALKATNPTLRELKSLTLEASVTQWSGLAKTRKHCRANFASTNFSLVVTNTAHPGQTVFYQYVMSRLCGTRPDLALSPCSKKHETLENFSTTNPLCVNDYPPVHRQDWLAQGKPTQVRVDILPNLKKAISETKVPVDRDLSHWSIRTMYCGQAIYGDTTVKSAWENISLTGRTSD